MIAMRHPRDKDFVDFMNKYFSMINGIVKRGNRTWMLVRALQ